MIETIDQAHEIFVRHFNAWRLDIATAKSDSLELQRAIVELRTMAGALGWRWSLTWGNRMSLTRLNRLIAGQTTPPNMAALLKGCLNTARLCQQAVFELGGQPAPTASWAAHSRYVNASAPLGGLAILLGLKPAEIEQLVEQAQAAATSADS